MKYQINPSATILSKKESRNKYIVQFLLDGSRILHRFSVPLVGKKILIALYESVSEEDIIQKFGVSKSELKMFLKPLLDAGLVLREKDMIDTLSFGLRNVRTVEFFNSFFTPLNTTKDMMNKLLSANILVFGLGGVGSWVVEMLARIGVGNIIIVDDDVVDLTNIPRQAMFTFNDIGNNKVAVAKRYIASFSKTSVDARKKRIKKTSDLIPLLSNVNLVINCADKPSTDITNSWVTIACFEKNQIPHILCGGYDGHLSFLGQTVIPGKSSCWFCYAESGIYESQLDGFEIIERSTSDHLGGTICPIGAQIASLQVQEAVKIITGCTQPAMLNRKAEVDFLNHSFAFTKIPKKKNCKICSQ